MSKRKQKYPVKERTVTALQLRSPVTLQRPATARQIIDDVNAMVKRGRDELMMANGSTIELRPTGDDYGTRTQFAWVAPD